MLRRSFLILVTVYGFLYAGAQSAESLVQKANSLYEQNKKEEAKVFYEKAALLNNTDAHFNLAYRYALSGDDRLFHYKKAALGGHGEAMGYFLDEAFFRQDNFFKADPFQALAVYESAYKRYPSMHFFDEKEKVKTLRYAAAAGAFDARVFVKTYRIDTSDLAAPYGVWKIAETVSRRKGIFHKADNRLLLQIISRGGFVPAELIAAVNGAYNAWKENASFEFNICDYVTSGYGMGYCARQAADKNELNIDKEIAALKRSLKNKAGIYLEPAYKAASAFFDSKVWNEELHGGSGYAAFAIQSLMEQKDDFIKNIKQINRGILPEGIAAIKDNDALLNTVYKKILTRLRVKPLEDMNASVNAEGVQKTQRLWVPYRDAMVKLLYTMMPLVTKQQWSRWITEQRITQLSTLLKHLE